MGEKEEQEKPVAVRLTDIGEAHLGSNNFVNVDRAVDAKRVGKFSATDNKIISKSAKPPKKSPRQQRRIRRQAGRQEKNSPQPQKAWRERFAIHPVVVVVGFVAALAVLIGLVHDALHGPVVDAIAVDVSQPFSLPFAVTNSSWVFDMRDAQLLCYFKALKNSRGKGLTNISIGDVARATIKPGDVTNFRCGITVGSAQPLKENDVLISDIAEGAMTIVVNYKTLWIKRTYLGTDFTWYTRSTPPRWIKGQVVN